MPNQKETKALESNIAYPEPRPFLVEFLFWFYFVAPRSLLEIWGNYLVSNLHYFSILLLLRTLLAPRHRDLESYGKGFDFDRFMKILGGNLVSRGVGFVFRAITILTGLLVEAVIFAGGLLFLVFWLAAPFALSAAFFYGLKLIL